MKTVAFFNNKGGVGKTSLVYHLAWMFAHQGIRVLAVDLDPQANLTAMFLNEDQLNELWNGQGANTVFHALRPIIERSGPVADPHVIDIAPNVGLVAGNLALSKFEDLLSENWPKALESNVAPFRVLTAFHDIIVRAAASMNASLILIDVGPNLGAINRAAMLAAQHVILPLAPDLFSLQGMKNLGPTLREWRAGWKKRLGEAPKELSNLPLGEMAPSGYVVMQHSLRDAKPVKAYQRWIDRIPAAYREAVLGEDIAQADIPTAEADPYRLALLKNYRSLMSMAKDAHKPMFQLRSSDGAIGAHIEAVQTCFKDFDSLATKISTAISLQR